ncbi:universal stress protein [Mycobacterium sp. MYCO198283]|uniref:universal stress protein n=1 Tax=Mycobacterium sp. MYCO198283 TaxID=2883505 RepID=UPI001E2CB542|nr:universal stress protein [Mycobacterium sp. MYCO198283]MCG5431888.1 universal stress protein [Mycobacterium sp. MYCO198283]
MTVVVGYLAGKGGHAGLHLAVELARALHLPLTVATVVPRPWTTPSPARIDAEYAEWADRLAADSEAEARAFLGEIADGVAVSFRKVAHRSVPGGLVQAAEAASARVLVLGSAADGQRGQVVIGSTADRLLHSSPVPLAVSPRGYRGAAAGRVTRITVGYPATPEAVAVVQRVAALTDQLEVPLRVVTFAVRGRTMYPPEVGLHAEDSILAEWASEARKLLAQLKIDGIVGPDVELQVVTGNDWGQALDATEWRDGDVLALGTSPRSGLTSVFLGSRGAKIVRHSPVPVLVLPA